MGTAQLTGVIGALVPASHWKSKVTGDFLGPELSGRFSIGLAKLLPRPEMSLCLAKNFLPRCYLAKILGAG